MRLEETIQIAFDKHPVLFGTRQQFLIYVFCVYGTGYEWLNGELVNKNSTITSKVKLDNNGIAIQRHDLKEVALKFLYDSTIKKVNEKIVPYYIFKKNLYKICKKDNLSLEECFLKHSIDTINQIRSSCISMLPEILSKEYSPIFNVPNDIKSDWANGLNEVYELLKELNIDLNKIK